VSYVSEPALVQHGSVVVLLEHSQALSESARPSHEPSRSRASRSRYGASLRSKIDSTTPVHAGARQPARHHGCPCQAKLRSIRTRIHPPPDTARSEAGQNLSAAPACCCTARLQASAVRAGKLLAIGLGSHVSDGESRWQGAPFHVGGPRASPGTWRRPGFPRGRWRLGGRAPASGTH
jgi:hypothetical protein